MLLLPAKWANFVLVPVIFFVEITSCNAQEFFSSSFLPLKKKTKKWAGGKMN
jgi:hypothetical protein